MLHMFSDGWGRPLTFFLSPGEMSDDRGALVVLAELPPAKRRLGDKGSDADRLRGELKSRGFPACLPGGTKYPLSRPVLFSHRTRGRRHGLAQMARFRSG